MYPGLRLRLIQAGMYQEPEDFVKKTVLSAFYMTTGFMIVVAAVLSKSDILKEALIFGFPIIFFAMFSYFLKLPEMMIIRREKEINRDLVFATRFLIIELESGVPVYDSLVHVAKNFQDIGKYFNEIIAQVDMGTPLPEAINRTIEITPSQNFRKILWQILNSLKTGADVSVSLKSVIDQIIREQAIEIKQYGRKLNPFAMFYMILAVIVPTLGTTMLIVFTSFIAIEIGLSALLMLVGSFVMVQAFFLLAIRGQRPSFEM